MNGGKSAGAPPISQRDPGVSEGDPRPRQRFLYASTTETGMRPRSEISYPFLAAHSRIARFCSRSIPEVLGRVAPPDEGDETEATFAAKWMHAFDARMVRNTSGWYTPAA